MKKIMLIYTYICVDNSKDNGKTTLLVPDNFKDTEKNRQKLARILEKSYNLWDVTVHVIIKLD